MRISKIIFCVVILFVHGSALAGLGTFFGTSESDWTRGQSAVIIATIAAVEPADPDSVGELRVTLLPKATLGGTFDCGAESKIVASCWYATGGDSALTDRPMKGRLVLVLLSRDIDDHFLRVPNSICPLFPNKEPICVIKGLDDPNVAKTLERIQKARAIAKKKEADENAKHTRQP